MTGPVYLGEDAAEVAQYVALRLASIAFRSIQDEGLVRIALSGGSTALALFDVLADEPFRSTFPWGQSVLLQVDERVTSPDGDGANSKAVRERLLAPLGSRAPVFHQMVNDPTDEKAAERYEKVLREVRGIDVAVMGMGEDGHTASLFPGFEAEWEKSKARVLMTSGPEPYPRRVSLGPRALASAGRLIFMVTGKSKQAALANPESVAARVASRAKQVEWWLDQAAAAALQ